MLAVAADLRNAARWSVALALGLRQGEALRLPWNAVDLDAGTMAVRQALQRQVGKGLVIVRPKSRAGRRVISLPGPLMAALRTHRAVQAQERLAAGPCGRTTSSSSSPRRTAARSTPARTTSCGAAC